MTKRLLIFSPYYLPHIGGLENHADEFNKHLSKKNYGITVFTPRLPKDALEEEVKYKRVKIIRFPAWEIIPNYPLPKFWSVRFWNLFIALFKNKFDLVISRTRFFNTSLMALIYSKSKRVRWLHIEHGSGFVVLQNNLSMFFAWLYDQIFGRLIFKTSDVNISISKAVQDFVYKFDKRKSLIIYRGLDFNLLDSIKVNKKIRNKYKAKTIIVFVGRLYKWKGVENTIRAIKSLPEAYKNKIVFLIIGGGEDFLRLEKLICGNKNIVMMGNVDHKQVISILKSSDIYIHSSLPGGGLSTSLLEAMYCKNIIIATPGEGANEVIDNTRGFLIGKSSSRQICKSIMRVLRTKKSSKMRDNAKNYIKNNFKWRNSIKKYLEILK